MNQLNQDQINIGNETALDLLVKQNNAKQELANNLNGLGVSANASTDTLEQLAYKVSTVISSNNRQEKESIGTLIPISGGSEDQIGFQIKNGWIFVIPSHDNNDVLYYKKLSSFELYNYYESIATTMQTKSNMNDEIWRNNYIKFSEDGNYLFTNNNTGINRWSVTWGSNYSTVSFSNKISITPTFEGNEDSIYDFDISGDGSKLIFQTESYGTGIINISSISTSTTVAYTPLQNLSSNLEFHWKFTNVDNEIMCIARNDGTNKVEMHRFSVTNNTCTEESRFDITCCNSSWWEVGFQIYKDLNNHYKIIYNNGGYNYDIPAFVIYDCSTKVFTQYFCYISEHYSSSRSYPISVFVKNNKYYLMAGMCILIFDSNWNLLGNTLVKLDYENFSPYEDIRNSVYWNGDIYAFSGDYYDSVVRYKTYFDKKLVYSRNVTPTGQSEKQLNYSAFPTEQQIIDGYYD